MAQKTITVGTPESKGSLDTNFGNAQDNFTELYNDLRINVKNTGATGDGITDDTTSILGAITSANGSPIFFPAGTYVIAGLSITGDCAFILDAGAVLLAKPNTAIQMLIFDTATSLSIEGGTIDGNKDNQTGRPYIITGHCQSGKKIKINSVNFRNCMSSIAYIQDFGGFIDFSNNRISGQAEADGIDQHDTSIIKVISGQADAKGLFRFNNNTCIGTATPLLEGGSPGGIFVNTAPVETPLVGNMSTIEAIGNYFYGYGLHCGINDISPIHTYPTTGGVRIIGNYFEQCGFCAISAKSAVNFVCADNVIVNGQWSAKNVASEGAISYVPGYQAGSVVRPRATITGNIIDSPGGQTDVAVQYGIVMRGIPTSRATDAVIANNVINNCGAGIAIDQTTNAIIANNLINGAETAIGGSVSGTGIYVTNVDGDIKIDGNRIVSKTGHGIYCVGDYPDARVFLSSNVIVHSGLAKYAAVVRGVKSTKFTGNVIEITAGGGVDIRANGTTRINNLYWDNSNTIIGIDPTIVYADIDSADGELVGSASPLNAVVPTRKGVRYTRLSDGSLWVSGGTTSDSWVLVENPLISVSTPTIAAGAVGLGAEGTAAITGTDKMGKITVHTGPTPGVGGGGVATITFGSAKSAAPAGVMLSPANGGAAVKIAAITVYDTAVTATTFSITAVATLAANTDYKWYYTVLD